MAVDARGNVAWESLDGGATWREVHPPLGSFCKSDDTNCQVDVTCFDGGCLAAEGWLRLGWQGDAAVTQPPPDVTAPLKPLPTPIVCKVADDATWRSVAGGELPDVSRASLNGVDWFAHNVDWTSAALTAHEMPASTDGSPQTMRTEAVFEPRSDANQWVVFSSHQTEGVAALRTRADSDVIDIAWRNLFSGHVTRRARLKNAGDLVSSPTRFSTRAGQPGLVSIARGGIFVRLAAEEQGATTYFIRDNGEVRELSAVTWPSQLALGRTEMATVDDVPVALKLFRGGAVLARASIVDQAWKVDAMSVGLDERVFQVKQSFELTYGQNGPLYYFWQESARGSQGTLFPMQSKGALLDTGVPAPTQRAVNATLEPRLCAAREMAAFPRIIAPRQDGVRYPVMVEHRSEPLRSFLTNFAVLYGPEDNACVAVFDADALTKAQGEEQTVLVRPEPRQASWLFRRVTGSNAFDYRPMSCRYDAAASLPNEVIERAQTHL